MAGLAGVGFDVSTVSARMPPSSSIARLAMSSGSALPCQPSLFSISEKPLPLMVRARIIVGPLVEARARSNAVSICSMS